MEETAAEADMLASTATAAAAAERTGKGRVDGERWTTLYRPDRDGRLDRAHRLLRLSLDVDTCLPHHDDVENGENAIFIFFSFPLFASACSSVISGVSGVCSIRLC